MDRYEREHAKYVALMQKRMQDILDSYEREITRIAGAVTTDPGKPFRFADYPALKARYDKLIKDMEAELQQAVESGVRKEWSRADKKNDALAIGVVGSVQGAAERGCLRRNEEALTAFLGRKAAGMTLSDRVWLYANQYDAQIQAAIDVALIDGKSAAELSRDVRSYLVHPDTLFRRVRDERGVLHLSQNAKAFHPGQGVYRSAYMNARRMAATEINMAYRTSDYMRIQQMDFVVGIEVHLSGNHNCKGIPPGQFFDICDELQGKYPKTFKFTGWHPHCRCYATTILKSREEMKEDAKRIKGGKSPSKAENSPQAVTRLPDNFTKWLADNQQRVATAKRLPYFLKDNGARNADGVWEPFIKTVPSANTTTPKTQSNIGDIIEAAEKYGIKKETVKKAEKILSSEDIINKISGGDKTKGSCSSLALTYAGNKAGFDVEDFRGGGSQEFFSRNSNIRQIVEKAGGVTESQPSDLKSGSTLLLTLKEGKEYYFACGRHAAIVRKNEGAIEYLELQSSKENGWKPFGKDTLKTRFGAQRSHTLYGRKYNVESVLLDIEKLKNDPRFNELLEYINTAAGEQKKGVSGGIK